MVDLYPDNIDVKPLTSLSMYLNLAQSLKPQVVEPPECLVHLESSSWNSTQALVHWVSGSFKGTNMDGSFPEKA